MTMMERPAGKSPPITVPTPPKPTPTPPPTPPPPPTPKPVAEYTGPLPDGETAIDIYRDVLLNIQPTASKLTYTKDMLTFRAQVEKEVAQTTKDDPEAMFDIPFEIPSTDVSGEVGVHRATQPGRNEDAINRMLRPAADEPIDGEDPFKDIPRRSATSEPSGTSGSIPAERALTPTGQQGLTTQDKPEGEGDPEVIRFGPGKTTFGDEEDGSDKPVDWYIDIDFPPLEQKDATSWVDAMTKLNMLLPPNPESQKLVISMALNALGVNDVDQVVDQIMTAAEEEKRKNPQGQMGGMPGMMGGMPGMPGMGGMPPRLPPGPQFMTPRKFGEADLSDERLATIVDAVREAVETLENVTEHGEPSDPDYAARYHPGVKQASNQRPYMTDRQRRAYQTEVNRTSKPHWDNMGGGYTQEKGEQIAAALREKGKRVKLKPRQAMDQTVYDIVIWEPGAGG